MKNRILLVLAIAISFSQPATAGRPSNAANLSVCPSGVNTAGVDVSDYDQGTQWSVVRATGATFTFIKATEGTGFTNPFFVSDWAEANTAGFVRGAFHVFHPEQDAAQQAEYFLAVTGPAEQNDLPPTLDLELTGNLPAAEQIQGVQTWLNLVEAATGKTPIIYLSPSYWNSLGNPLGFDRYPLYIGEYLVECPNVPPPWSGWAFWQSAIGTVDGIKSKGRADTDIFSMPADQLTAFILSLSHQDP